MRFTEHELTAAVTAAAKTVAAGRRHRKDPDARWEAMGRYQRYQVMDAVGTQILPVLVDLPDVEVEPGTRPTFTTAQVRTAVEQHVGEVKGRVRRAATVAARTALVTTGLSALPVRQDPDGLLEE